MAPGAAAARMRAGERRAVVRPPVAGGDVPHHHPVALGPRQPPGGEALVPVGRAEEAARPPRTRAPRGCGRSARRRRRARARAARGGPSCGCPPRAPRPAMRATSSGWRSARSPTRKKVARMPRRAERVEHARRPFRVGPVVEGERDELLGGPDPDDRAAERPEQPLDQPPAAGQLRSAIPSASGSAMRLRRPGQIRPGCGAAARRRHAEGDRAGGVAQRLAEHGVEARALERRARACRSGAAPPAPGTPPRRRIRRESPSQGTGERSGSGA